MCNYTDSNDQSKTYMTHKCYVNHSINTVPTFSCPGQDLASAAIEDVESEMKQIHVSQCAYDSILYNLTSLTLNTTDTVNQVTCTVRYTDVERLSTIYLEEPFEVFQDLKKTQTTRDNTDRCSAHNLEGK